MGLRTRIGGQIRARREHQGLTVRELAERCGLAYQTVSGIENGTNTSLDTLERILAALDDRLFADVASGQDPLVRAAHRAAEALDDRTREVLIMQLETLIDRADRAPARSENRAAQGSK